MNVVWRVFQSQNFMVATIWGIIKGLRWPCWELLSQASNLLTVFSRAPVLTEQLHTLYWLKLGSWYGWDFNLWIHLNKRVTVLKQTTNKPAATALSQWPMVWNSYAVECSPSIENKTNYCFVWVSTVFLFTCLENLISLCGWSDSISSQLSGT